MRKLYDINIIYEGKTVVQQDVSKLTLRGLSPLIVSDQAIKKESSDIFKAKEVLIYKISTFGIEKGVEYTVTGKVVNNNKNYSITATGTVFGNRDENGKYTFKLTNIKGTEIADPINYVIFGCKYDGAEIIPLTKDAKINWTTYSIDSTYYGQTITLKKGTNKIELPYGYIIGNNTYTSEDGKTTDTIIDDIDFTYADTSKWIYFKHLATSTLTLRSMTQFDLSNAIIFSELCGAGVTMKYISVTGLDFSNVQVLDFANCTAYSKAVKDIDTSNVRIMDKCFYYNLYVTFSDLLKWKTDKVTSMVSMFERCPKITKLDLSTWNVSNVKSFQRMFYGCDKLEELDLSGWDMAATANVTDMFVYDTALKKIIVKNCTQYTLDLIRKALKDSNYSWTYNGIAFIII